MSGSLENTPTASTSSGGSPGPFSPRPHQPESALTSASTSPPFAQTGFPNSGKSMEQGPGGFDQAAASFYASQQFQQQQRQGQNANPSTPLPMPLPMNMGTSLPPYLQSMQSSSFPSQLPVDLINAANIAPSSLPVTPHPAFSGAASPVAFPNYYGSMPSTPYPMLNPNPYNSSSMMNPAMDPNLYALHASLEAQARLAAATSMSAPGSPANFDSLQSQQQHHPLSGSSTPVPPAVAPHSRSHTRPGPKRSNSGAYLKTAVGASTSAGQHQRAFTQPMPAGSPLASPSAMQQTFDPSTLPYGLSPAPSFQRPLPPLPKRQAQTASSSSTNHQSSSSHSSRRPSATDPTPPISRTASPRHTLSPVAYDFTSLEEDLDRFTSSGGFASAAAAAMASVGPASRRGHQGVDAYGVGGYGGSPIPKFTEALPSPRLVEDVLGREPLFYQGGNGGNGSNHPSPGHATNGSPSNSSQLLPGGVVNVLSNELGTNKSSPASSASPAGSTIIDEESAELLSQKDPIAAQVWRMFHKAKNTMPNGARMENLTWRLMSMTLRKRREESAAQSNEGGKTAGAAVSAASPGTEDARLRKAMEEAIEEEREEKEVVEEGRDIVQPLAGGRGRNTQTRGRREANDISEDEERGRTRGSRTGASSKSASPEVEA